MTTDLIERLREHAEHHKELSYECDCKPEDTRNWQHYLTDLEAAAEIERLKEEYKRLTTLTDNWRSEALYGDRRIHELSAEVERLKDGGGCTYTRFGRGDCEHFVGLPGLSIPDQHDGDDDTVDAYGKPNGWCWSCWKSYKIERQAAEIGELKIEMKQVYQAHKADEEQVERQAALLKQCLSAFRQYSNETFVEHGFVSIITRNQVVKTLDAIETWKEQ